MPLSSPLPTIANALAELTPTELIWRPPALPADVSEQRTPGRSGARRIDLERMSDMGAGHLSVGAILLPADSDLLIDGGLMGPGTQRILPEPMRLDLSKQLTRFFPCHFVAALYELQSILNRMEAKAYVIGGIVRDLLIIEDRKLELNDVDISVEGDAITCAQQIESLSRNFKLDQTFPEFGTAILHYKDQIYIDLASTRKERYASCGALPEVFARGVTLREDVIRRDFTMNALALSIHQLGEIIDWTGGIADIEAQQIQVLHGASFFEDPSRILRGFKFGSRLNFELTPTSESLMKSFLSYGAEVYKGGGERIKEELSEFLQGQESPTKTHWLKRFEAEGVLKLCHMKAVSEAPANFSPSTPWDTVVERFPIIEDAVGISTPDSESPEDIATEECQQKWEAYLCLLLQDLPEEALEKLVLRLNLNREEREAVESFRKLKKHRQAEPETHWENNLALYQLFHPYPLPAILAHMLETPVKKDFESLMVAWIHYERKLAHMSPDLDGHDLIELGIPAGKTVGEALKALLHARLSNQVFTRLDEIQYIQSHYLHSKPLAAQAAYLHKETPHHVAWAKPEDCTADGDLADEVERDPDEPI